MRHARRPCLRSLRLRRGSRTLVMCGIAGALNLDDQPVDRDVLRAMIRSIRHRGPDAEAVWQSGPVGLAHARLSIIDLAGGQQPMSNAEGTLWITYNGELFN